jgi:sugar-specific transcriptional regulator TrmB
MEEKSLKKLGLEDSEIKLYLTLLKLGSSTATSLAKETGINRSYLYDILERLINRGLVSFFAKNNIKYFNAISPESLVDYADNLKKDIQKLIPELEKIKSIPKEATKVELFQGKEGLKTLLKDIINERKNYVVFGEEGQFQNMFPVYIQQFLRDASSYGIEERLLTKTGVKKNILQSKKSQIRHLPNEYFSPVSTVVYSDKVSIFIWKEPYFAVLITDEEVAKSYRNYFNALWDIAKK